MVDKEVFFSIFSIYEFVMNTNRNGVFLILATIVGFRLAFWLPLGIDEANTSIIVNCGYAILIYGT